MEEEPIAGGEPNYIVDVGANSGEFLFEMARRCPDHRILGIEPIPELYEGLACRKVQLGFENVELVQVAIDLTEKQAHFNVARHADWGVSSLLEFDLERMKENPYWKKRKDLYFDECIEVAVVRLETLFDARPFCVISFIKIDAQGLDLNVLQSLGKYLPRVEAGMLEVPSCATCQLYARETQTLFSALGFLHSHGFAVYAIKPNDPACAEVNVFFHRSDVAWQEVEKNLRLRGVHLYDGKHYWHGSSDSPPIALVDGEREQD